MKAKDVIIYSDMDGTLLSDWSLGPIVPERNLRAIDRFIKQGGLFSIASGRQYADILRFFPQSVRPNAPIVCGNGSNVYDLQTNTLLYKIPLPFKYKRPAVDYMLSHKDVWLVCADEFNVYQVMTGEERDAQLKDTFPRAQKTIRQFLDESMTKVVYVTKDAAAMPSVKRDVSKFAVHSLVTGTQSGPLYYEMVDKSVSKADGVKRAIEHIGATNRIVVGVGDYLNDYEMLKHVDYPVCPSNSAKEIKEIAKFVTCDNNSGAIAEVIERLID